VPGTPTRGHLDRCGPVVGGELGFGSEPGDVTDIADDLSGPDRADPVDVTQTGARRQSVSHQ